MKTARSESDQSVNKMMPPATTVTTPLTEQHPPAARGAVEVVGRVERIRDEHRSLLWFGTS